ncbi:uncharacterized protein LOC113519297 [Galleria mellonella]|uniref:Uncharacterized protein LOC113519297 n=1 Tax=Galleria mellonella TaxID=7137 RepID=A0A6J1WW02_GALME|nr:uncharacterized protein LOC113519297 [Galleria mellonella]
MYRYVAVAVLVVMDLNAVTAPPPPPVRLTIDCGSKEKGSLLGLNLKSKSYTKGYLDSRRDSLDVDSFCDLIHGAIPDAIRDGKIVLEDSESDQDSFENTHVPISLPPPKGFIPDIPLPKFKVPKLGIPKFKVPNLRTTLDGPLSPPKVGSAMLFTRPKDYEEESSAERLEKFRKGVQKMLHVVKVLGEIDQYISERTRIVVDKLSKTFAE